VDRRRAPPLVRQVVREQAGGVAADVNATPTTGASVAVEGCTMLFMWYRPLSKGVRSWVVMGSTAGGSPVT
jgi:hypothetical protein